MIVDECGHGNLLVDLGEGQADQEGGDHQQRNADKGGAFVTRVQLWEPDLSKVGAETDGVRYEWGKGPKKKKDN